MIEAQPRKLILAVDGSPHANTAVDLVAGIGWHADAAVHLLTIVPALWSPRDPSAKEARVVGDILTRIRQRNWEAAQQVTAQVAERLDHMHADKYLDNLEIVTEIHEGSPAEVIVERARALPADLIAIGARGLKTPDEFRLGATAYKVAAHANCTVLVARAPAAAPLARVVLAIDGSPEAWRAVEWVDALALPPDAEVLVISVAEVVGDVPAEDIAERGQARDADLALMQRALLHTAETQVETALDRLRTGGMRLRPIVRIGQPAAEIVRIIQEHDADLLVIGARGQTRAEAFPFGGVVEKLIRFAPCSVLVAR